MANKKSGGGDGRMLVNVRIPPDVIDAADELVSKLGVGDRATVIRRAAIYGLRAFLAKPTILRTAPTTMKG